MLGELWLRLLAILGIGAGDRELDDELRFHLDRQVEKGVASGVSRAEAMRRARVELGGVEQVKEDYRDGRSLWLVDTIVEYAREIRYAFRMLARTPAFAAVAALSLALGIGVNSAIFSLHDALLWRPLPVPDPGAVVTVSADRSVESADEAATFGRGVSYPDYRDLREKSGSFDGLVAYQLSTFSFATSRTAVREMKMGMLVSDNFFDVLGIQPVLGRRFAREEGRVPGRDSVVVLGYDFWKSAFSGDSSILYRVVPINGVDFTVVGVAPASFTGMDPYIRPAFFLPIMMAQQLSTSGAPRANPLEDRTARWFNVKGRLKPGVSQRRALAELTPIWTGLAQQYPDANRNRTMAVRSELEERFRSERDTATLIVMMTGLVAIVLIIASANVANLLLGRARARSREMAIRLALGVSRMRLLRQLLTESLVLASIGGVLGLGVAYGGIRFLQTLQVPTDLPVVISTRLDLRVVAFSVLATAVSTVLFGMAPAWQSLKTSVVSALKNPEGGLTAGRRTVGRNVLVVAQIALSMVLLVVTGMFLDGFRKLLVVNPGFRTDHLIMLSTDTSLVRYTPLQTHDFYRALADRARALPGVASVALTSAIPMDPSGQSREIIVPEGYQFPRGQENVSILAAAVDEHYFATMKIEILRGRAFTADDKDGSRRVVIVNEELAKAYWPNQDPIGRRMRLNGNQSSWLEVVGLAKTGKYVFAGEPPTQALYLPFAQHERTQMSLLVEATNQDAAPLAATLRDVVRALDVNQPIFNVRTLSSFYTQRAIAPQLLIMQVVATVTLIGLTLALIGLYALVAYSVARRTREIGIRMAIGAGRMEVLRMVLRQGFMLSMTGIILGGAASVAVSRLLTAGMAGLGAPNPATFVIVPVMLIGLTMAASYFPARRASLVDPVRALKYE